jgi:hypothetical protein
MEEPWEGKPVLLPAGSEELAGVPGYAPKVRAVLDSVERLIFGRKKLRHAFRKLMVDSS